MTSAKTIGAIAALWLGGATFSLATPTNKAALGRHFDRFLAKDLNHCSTCHLPSSNKDPQSLEDFPHNAFGDRLRALGDQWADEGKDTDIIARITAIETEDSDGDGTPNGVELLAGTNPGDPKQVPTSSQLDAAPRLRADFEKFLASYRWKPYARVQRPPIPPVQNADWVRTPLDAFIAAEHEERGLRPRPMASKRVLLRRVYLDLIGLSPTPEEQLAFEQDHSSDAYEKVVDRLLADPRYAERWGRHWMDIWRYSDWAGWTDGKQVRDSQRHIWRWRDWIVQSLMQDKPYDRMILEMLAGDELAPNDPEILPATGFLVRNYKMLSREQWLEDTVKHTAQAFLGITLGCAKCHDHMTDPISQAEYYRVRAIFEPHQVRIDRVPGELNIEADGLPRIHEEAKVPDTFFLIRGDERKPDKDRKMAPGVPKALCGDRLKPDLAITPVSLPREAVLPDRREFVREDTVAASLLALKAARDAAAKELAKPEISETRKRQVDRELAIAEQKHAATMAVLRAERLEDAGKKGTEEWREAASDAATKQRRLALAEGLLAVDKALTPLMAARDRLAKEEQAARDAEAAGDAESKKKHDAAVNAAKAEIAKHEKARNEAVKLLTKAEEKICETHENYEPRAMTAHAETSTGRRLAFAQWIANADNPLTARVAANHIWLRHFGRGIVATPENLGLGGAIPSHPALLDWLAAEFMENGWRMKPIHRMIVTSATYRMASTPDSANAGIDPDNEYLWRMPSRRMEAELIRDNVLYTAGSLDESMGGPEIDHKQGLVSKRRSLYLRIAAEKDVEFLTIFDGPTATECYQRRTSVLPQQALALTNSTLPAEQSRILAQKLTAEVGADDAAFAKAAFRRVLAREATDREIAICLEFLTGIPAPGETQEGDLVRVSNPRPAPERLRENLIAVLFNHSDFVTIR